MSTSDEKPSESASGERQRATLVVIVDVEVDDIAAAQLAAPRVAQLVRHRTLDAIAGVHAGVAVATVADCDARAFVSSLGKAVAQAQSKLSESL